MVRRLWTAYRQPAALWFLVATSTSGCVDSVELFGEAPAAGGAGGAVPETGGADSGGASQTGGIGGTAPLLVPGPSGAALQVDAGNAHSCGIADGGLYCWGENGAGQLGLGDFTARITPSPVEAGLAWDAVSTGYEFTCALRAGSVWCVGAGSNGQLGSGAFSSSTEFVEVVLPGAATAVEAGFEFACALLADARVFCWGAGTEGQLAQDDPFPEPGLSSAIPVEVPGGAFAMVAAGQGHGCGVKVDGALYCWGRNASGELGLGASADQQIRTPQRVGADSDWATVAAGQNHTCAIRADGSLWCWGDNPDGQLGLGDTEPRFDPTLVSGLDDVEAVALDTFHTCALRASGELLCAGRNDEGMLGVEGVEGHSTFTIAPSDGAYVGIAAGRFHTCGVAVAGGQSWFRCAGENGDGRLGTGDTLRRYVFTQTAILQ